MIGRKNFQFKPWICFIIVNLVLTAAAGMLYTGCEQGGAPIEIDLADRFTEMELQNLKPEQDKNGLKFSFDLRGSLLEDSRQYLPLLNYLEKQTGYQFELHFITEEGKLTDDLGAGRVHLAAVGASTFLQATAKYGAISLVRGVNSLGKAEYQSLIFVSSDSSVRRVEDLRGKSFAFGSVNSTQGHLIPRISLFKHGLTLKDLADFKYTGSHQNCAEAVISGRFDAGGMQDTLGKKLAEAGLIRIIYTSKYYPSSGIVANKNMTPEMLTGIKQALLDFRPRGRDKAGLYHWEKTEMPNGFIEAKMDDYSELSEWAHKLGLLAEQKTGARE